MTTGDFLDQHRAALDEKIIRVIYKSKKFAKIVYAVHNVHVTIEVQLKEIPTDTYDWLNESARFIYGRYNNDANRVEKLYALIAQRWPDSDVIVSELTSDGSGTTTHFSTSYLSQVTKV